MSTALPGRNRARAAIFMFGLAAIVALLVIVLGVLHASEVGSAEDVVAVLSEEGMSATTGLFLFANLLQILLTIGALIAFLVWVYRAFVNLRDAGINTEFTPGWAVGWFFVPIANLFMAYRAIRELWHKSGGETEEPGLFNAPEPAPILGVWWGAWIVNTILGNVGSRIYDNSETTAQMATGAWIISVANILEIISALLTIHIIVAIMKRQATNVELNPRRSPPPPPDFTAHASRESASRIS